IHRLRRVGCQMAQLPVGAARCEEIRRRREEDIPELALRSFDDLAILRQALGLRGYDRMSEAEGDVELERQARIDTGIIAAIGRNRGAAEQVRQKFFVRDVLYLRRDDGARVVIELVAAPGRVCLVQRVDLVVVLTYEERMQRGQRKVLRGARIAG